MVILFYAVTFVELYNMINKICEYEKMSTDEIKRFNPCL